MDCFERLGIFFIEIDSSYSAVVNLSKELAEICPSLMPNPRLGKQSTAATGFENTNREVDIFSEAHLGEPSEPCINIATNAHIERTGIEFVEFFLAAAYSTRSKKGRHRIRNGFLRIGKRGVRTVGTAESIGRFTV